MSEPRWVSKGAVRAWHSEQLAEHGGSDNIRDETLLDSALAKPLNVVAYEDGAEIFRLAASYVFGIARNRAFDDGKKRTALVVSAAFSTSMAGIFRRHGRSFTSSFCTLRRER